MRRRLVMMILACASSAGALRQTAGAAPVAIESYGGHRPDDAAAVVDPLLADLARRGFLTGSSLLAQIERDISRSGEALSTAEANDIVARSDAGYKAFVQGKFDDAVTILEEVWAAFVARPATVAERQELRDGQIKTLIGLALAKHRLGDQEAALRYMSEFLRSFPDREISRALYGPEPAELAKKVRTELERSARGSLRIEVLDDPGGVIFVNERYVSVGSAALKLYPGIYRVHVRGKLSGRVHDVNVGPGAKEILQVRLSAESALKTVARSPGLFFADEDGRALSEPAAAASIGAALRATEVAVVGIRVINGRRTLIGALVAAGTGRPIRSGALVMEPMTPSSRQIAALGRFLASGEIDPTVTLTVPASPRKPPRTSAPSLRRKPWFKDTWGWVIAGTGLAVTGVGVGLLINASSLDSDADDAIDEQPRLEFRDRASSRRTIGAVCTAIGAGVVTLGVIKLGWPNRRSEKGGETRVTFGPTWARLEGTF